MSASITRIDARGISCPEPVMMTKKALQENFPVIEVIVDNAAAKGNIERFARMSGCSVTTKEAGSDFILTITKA